MKPVELLAPAGDRDAALAALHYGADAIYLGLQQFSARAEAANFTIEALSEIVALAHASRPRRAVFVAANTLVFERETADLARLLGGAGDLGVDAFIVQDLGVARLARRCAPDVALHASTQMAIHNVEGARMLRQLGFSRVTLARELTLDEIRDVAAGSGLEVEVFVHGALCYAYSGLCLYSSLSRGRSGNRGRCTYPCRERFAASSGEAGFPFSMKDLALPDAVGELRAAGVFSYKIEGRKKSPLYVAATTHYYRRLLDGRLTQQACEEAEADIQTVFARPWTGLYVRSPRNRDVVDADVVGHRGTPVARAEAVVRHGHQDWLRFTTRRRLERHDGLQVDVGDDGRPFGFAVDELRVVEGGSRRRNAFEAEAGSRVEVLLPSGHPQVDSGTTVYCSSSQAVKQRYRFERPRPGAFRVRWPVTAALRVGPDAITVDAAVAAAGARTEIRATAAERGVFEVGRRADAGEPAIREAFARMGDTDFELKQLVVENPDRRFVPVSVLNRLRRGMATALAEAFRAAQDRRTRVVLEAGTGPTPVRGDAAGPVRWSVKTDRLEHVAAFGDGDWAGVEELIVDVSGLTPAGLVEAWAAHTGRLGVDRVRMALPMLMREWERPALHEAVGRLWQAGCRRWEASNLWAWPLLEAVAGREPFDLVTDWPVYVWNQWAARALQELGVKVFTVSPEDGLPNMADLLAAYGSLARVTLYQDTPLFVSENCGRAGLARECRADGACRRAALDLVSGHDEHVRLIQRNCRTLVVGALPFCLGRHQAELRRAGASRFKVDFMWRHYAPDDAVEVWRNLRAGRPVPGVDGNFVRGPE